MSGDAPAEGLLELKAFEAMPVDDLETDVFRRLAEALADAAPAQRGMGGAAPSAVVPAETYRLRVPGAAAEPVGPEDFSGPDLTFSRAALYGAVQEVLGDILGEASQVLVLRDTAPELRPVITAVMEQIPAAVQAQRQALSEAHINALVSVYLAHDPLSAALPDLERDNAEAQARFLTRWPVLTAEQLAARAGHSSDNKSATASRWKSAGRIFGVRSGGREVYPAFQFTDGQPHPTIRPTLAALPATMSPWQTAFWFIGPNGWLDDAAPVDRLDDTVAVTEAAAREGRAWMG